MKILLYSFFVFSVTLGLGQGDRTVTYWEYIGDEETKLAQVIHTLNDQGERVYHLNLFLSSCTTEVYYAVPSGEEDRYIFTNNFGEPTQHAPQHFLYEAELYFNQQAYKQVTLQQYKSEMKKLEANKHINSLKD